MGNTLESSGLPLDEANAQGKSSENTGSKIEVASTYRTDNGRSSLDFSTSKLSTNIEIASTNPITREDNLILADANIAKESSLKANVPDLSLSSKMKTEVPQRRQSMYEMLSAAIKSHRIPDVTLHDSGKSDTQKDLVMTNPFPGLKLTKTEDGSYIVKQATVKDQVSVTDRKQESGITLDGIPRSNLHVLAAAHRQLNKKPWQSSPFQEYLEGGKIAGGASVSQILKSIGFKFKDSANPKNLLVRLAHAGWTFHGVDEVMPGDVIVGGKKGTNWRAGKQNADIAIVSADRQHVYHNDRNSGSWTASKLADMFNKAKNGETIYVLRPPKELDFNPRSKEEQASYLKPVQRQPESRHANRPESPYRQPTQTDRPSEQPRTTRTDDGGDIYTQHWKNQFKDYWSNYWKDYWQEYYASRERNNPYNRTRTNPYDRASTNPYDRNERRVSHHPDDQYLPPGWSNGRWRHDGRDRRSYDDRGSYQPRNGRTLVRPYNGTTSIISDPTITVAQIESVLAKYNSPARGLGQKIFDLGVKYRINPALALAFFVKESSAGTKGVAVRTKNWGNRKARGGGWLRYNSFGDSLEPWYQYMIRRYVNRGMPTIETALPVYAPAYENNTRGYINGVRKMLRQWSVNQSTYI